MHMNVVDGVERRSDESSTDIASLNGLTVPEFCQCALAHVQHLLHERSMFFTPFKVPPILDVCAWNDEHVGRSNGGDVFEAHGAARRLQKLSGLAQAWPRGPAGYSAENAPVLDVSGWCAPIAEDSGGFAQLAVCFRLHATHADSGGDGTTTHSNKRKFHPLAIPSTLLMPFY